MKKILRSVQLSFGLIWSFNRKYLLLTFVSIILDAIQVFPGMYLMNYSIDLLTRRVAFGDYFTMLLILIGIMLATALVLLFVNDQLAYEKENLRSGLRNYVNRVCLDSDYMDLQMRSYQEKREFALKAIDNDSLDLFIDSVKSLVSSLIILSGVVFIVSKVSLIIMIPVVISLLLDLLDDYLNARQNFVDTKEDIEYRRKSSYLHSISSDFAFAKEIRMFNLKERFKARMDEVEELMIKLREIRRKRLKPSAMLVYSSEALLDISVYLYFGWKVISASISLGNFSLYVNALHQLHSTFQDVIYIATNFIVNIEYLEGLSEFIKLKNGKNSTVKTDAHPDADPRRAELRFENVSFRYPGSEDFALKDVNLKINSGEKILVVGENGAGKTTFVKLICGLLRPTSGRILLNGVDISTIPYDEYLHCLSAVFQDYKLLAVSIAENISALSVREWTADDYDKVERSVADVGLTDKINSLPQNIRTSLYRIFDKNGVELSGGEAQKLAVARAIYKDAPVILLDEPTSALDPKAEYEIFGGFRKLAADRTAVYVSHRLSSVKFTDRIVVFESGELKECGTHDELMKKDGQYAKLYSMQAELYKTAAPV